MDSFKNSLLISMPHLADAYFDKTVIYICEHSNEGSMGLVINRPLSKGKTSLILQSLGLGGDNAIEVIPEIYFGGPVEQNHGFVLHSSEYELGATAQISNDVSLTTDLKIIADIKQGLGPHDFRLVLGYAGWGPEQLDREIANGDWLVIPAESQFIFDTPDTSKWTSAARQFGIEITQISGFGGSA